jgi:hypothetical protein
MTGAAQVLRFGVRVDGNLDGAGSVFGGDAGTNTVDTINADGKGGLVFVGVFAYHEGQFESIEPIARQGQTNQTPRVHCHEIDAVRRGELGGTNDVAFVFAVFVIDYYQDATCFEVCEGAVDRVKLKGLC